MRLRVKVHGMVQGVFFRQTTVEKALELGLKGYVKNCPDSTVEVVSEGPKDKLEELLAWCRSGPGSARVDKVDLQWLNATNEFDEFSIRW